MTMTSQVSKPEAEALAAYLHAVRTVWDVPGIMAALQTTVQTRPWLTLDRLAAVSTRAAKNPKARTPAVIPLEGQHWREDLTPAAPIAFTACPDHPDTRTRRDDGECGGCYADRVAVGPTATRASVTRTVARKVNLRELVRAHTVPTPGEPAGQDDDSGYEIRGDAA